MAPLDNPVISPGSTILVTGVNGFVGSHTADQLLQHGYKVRGTVREGSKHSWLAELFEKKYGCGNFEMVVVKDMGEDGAFDAAVAGVSGVAHIASVRSTEGTTDELIRNTIAGTLNCLRAAAKEPKMQRFVLTSSSAAVRSLEGYRGTNAVSAQEYDEETVALSKAIPSDLLLSQKFLIAYFASKVRSEQVFWEWIEENKPHFSANSVLPPTIYGGPLDVSKQGFPSTAKFPLNILDGDVNSIKYIQRWYFVNVKDVARLHVAGLIHPGVSGERIFAFAGTYSINELFDIYAKYVPWYRSPEKLPDLDYPLAPIIPRGKAESLLRDLGRPGFTDLEQTIKENIETRIKPSQE